MSIKSSFVFVIALALLASPLAALAHETQQFEIGDKTYQFIVGSINEPVAVDDKSGVEVTVSFVEGHQEEGGADESQPHDHEVAAPVTGLDQTLKVEVSAGDMKKEFALAPLYGEGGTYRAVFFPTVQTTYAYRFFGTINNVPVDLSFTCNPAGHPATEEDTSEVNVSPGVNRVLKRGAFGCPRDKVELGFPEPAPTLASLEGGGEDNTFALVGMIFGILGFAMGGAAYRMAGNKTY